MIGRALLLVLLVAGCNPITPAPTDGGAADLAPLCSSGGIVDLGRYPCGASWPGGSCRWSCFFSPTRGYEWQQVEADCCSGAPCGQLTGVNEPCAWRCTFDPRGGGSYQWEEIYRGCSSLDGGARF